MRLALFMRSGSQTETALHVEGHSLDGRLVLEVFDAEGKLIYRRETTR